LSHPIYRKRRYYGLCWTALYYCKPVYFVCLTIPWLKRLTFRLFGYRGQMDFTVHPDTWIRDLPLLDLGKGVYIANRATLGTNMPLKNGKILVNGIRIGARSLVGHLTMLAAGVELGEDTQIESGSALGMFVRVGSRSSLGANITVDHYAKIGNAASVGNASYVGCRSRLSNGAVVPPFSVWPGQPRTHVDFDQAVGLRHAAQRRWPAAVADPNPESRRTENASLK
jgi:carbonic anhydrase/acetyltransferase-like protein (isoleucine patch superfamily)